jgi:hypothetical protein
VTENSIDGSDNCSEAIRTEDVANGDAGTLGQRLFVAIILTIAENMSGIDCLDNTASAWGPSLSTTIGNELAAVYDHVDHCRNIYCLYARFFDEMQSPRELDTCQLPLSIRLLT